MSGMGDTENQGGGTAILSVIDRDGNMVALTQTLLSLFGSRVMLPESGVLMNNGIMWFDTRPGRPNSIGAAKRPLSNMLPVLALDGDAPGLAIGAAGGRRLMPAVRTPLSLAVGSRLLLDAALDSDIEGRGKRG